MRLPWLLVLAAAGCTSTTADPLVDASPAPELGEAEICNENPSAGAIRFVPRELILAPGQVRTVRIYVEPDACEPADVLLTSSASDVAWAVTNRSLDYGVAVAEASVVASSTGEVELTASVTLGALPLTATLPVYVAEPRTVTCSVETVTERLEGGGQVAAAGDLEGAGISLPEGADRPEEGGFVWSVPPFDASVGCGEPTIPSGYEPLGPPVEFGPAATVFRRDVPMAVPVQPQRLPETASFRHVEIAYQGPAHATPRIVPVTSPRFERVGDTWRLAFSAPRLGTYQAVVRADAGRERALRRMTHRAILGASMGAAAATQAGLRHHQLFDVVGPLGGPTDWTYMLQYSETNHLGGFRPIAPGTPAEAIPVERAPCQADTDCAEDERCLGVLPDAAGACTFLPEPRYPYEHTQTFNTLWYEAGEGNGGAFTRRDYIRLFRDLSLMLGNPFSYNPDALQLSAGIDPSHPVITGGRDDGRCATWVQPYDHPDEETMKTLDSECPAARCAETLVLDGYYDAEFNPDGTFPVITFCDGGTQRPELSPYANAVDPDVRNVPTEAGLAVDYNGNGRRDELEPLITAGHEPWRDWGPDGLPSEQEPGYGPDLLDPAGDDYDPRYNPRGTEGDARYQEGEPFDDLGLDGVAGTASSPYDVGEGDGVFTAAPGLAYSWDVDSRSLLRGESSLLAQPLDDDALDRLDVFIDGGNRDLFNFHVASEHLLGSFVARGQRATAYHQFHTLPGSDAAGLDDFAADDVAWELLPGVTYLRYGNDDYTADDLARGLGGHAGSAKEAILRLETAISFAASRWPDAPRTLVEASSEDPADDADACEISGQCTFDFTSSFGRTGPVIVTLPPGYAHRKRQGVRYPVMYLTHGYGMDPAGLSVLSAFVNLRASDATASQATRLPQVILVFVDGRCRWQGDDEAECMTGTFYLDSLRPEGAQNESWMLELIDHVDRTFRTMPETYVETVR